MITLSSWSNRFNIDVALTFTRVTVLVNKTITVVLQINYLKIIHGLHFNLDSTFGQPNQHPASMYIIICS
jgi:hypothetical protein